MRSIVFGLAIAALLTTSVCPAESPAVLASDVASQPLAQALTELAEQTSLQFIYLSELASGRVSQAVPAGTPIAAALARMLDDTGLRAEFLNSRTVRIVRIADAAPASRNPGPAGANRGSSLDVEPAAATLEEIIVTATKRAELLNEVPISAAVLTAKTMEASGIKALDEIGALTPGVEYEFVTNFGAGTRKNISIRGVNSYVGAPTTAIYLDDSPIQALTKNFGSAYPVTFDLARVEVLRGPQGTLFGVGAEGGAVRFILREPSLTTASGFATAEFATTEHGGLSYEAGAAAGGPLVPERIGFRVSGWYRTDGGYVDRVNPFTGATVDANANRASSKSARAALTVAPSETIRITSNLVAQAIGMHDSPDFYTYLSNPAAGVLRSGKLLPQPADDRFTLASVKLTARFEDAEFTSVTSYLDRTGTASADYTNLAGAVYFGGYGNPLGVAYPSSYGDAVPTTVGVQQTVVAEEARWASSDPSERLTWVAGVFFSRARQHDTQTTTAPAVSTQVGIQTDDVDLDTQYAVFGQVDFKIVPRLKLSGGLRIARFQGDFTEHAGGFAFSGVPDYSSHSAAERPVTPRAAVSFQPDEHNFYYATVAKGHRNGDVNVPVATQCMATIPSTYGPDEVWSYEIGAKNTLFGGRVQLDSSAYHLSWQNLQQVGSIASCGFGYTLNLGAAASNGFDAALHALLSDRLRIGLTVGYTQAHFTKTTTIGGVVNVDRGTVVGGLPTVPSPWILSASADYGFPIRGGLAGRLHLDDVFHSRNPGPYTEYDPASVDYYPSLRPDPSTNRVNLRAGVSAASFDVMLYVVNVFNSQPTLQRVSDARDSNLFYATTFRPRTVGIATTWRF